MINIKNYLKKENGFLFFMLLSFVLADYKIAIQLDFELLPIFFFLLGAISYQLKPEKSLYLFLFLLPIVNALPDFFFNGYPFNYMGVALFYLSGIVIAARFGKGRSEKATEENGKGLSFDFKWAGPYFLFLVILWVSALFVLLRWSNITLPSLAFWKDTPVTPSGELVSFASIFPIVTLFLFSTAPYLLVLIRKHRLEQAKVFNALVVGYTVSFAIGLFQKFIDPDFMAIKWWGEKLDQYNGGFSDFNAFGFFSGALFFYLVMAMVNRVTEPGFKITRNIFLNREFLFNAAGLVFTLAGIFLSGCRTAFLFVLFAVGFLFFTRKIKLLYKLVSILLIVVLLFAAGGTLKKRMAAMAENAKKIGTSSNIITALDKVTNGRIEMMERSIPIIKKYPLTGIGSGNFLFFLKYRYLGEQYWEDLPLNHYLLILDETGMIGLFVFVCFLVFLLRQKRKKIFFLLLIAMLTAVFFNFFFWFPEVLLLFWIVSAFAQEKEAERAGPGRKKRILFSSAVLLLFVIFNVLHFDSLHPKTWVNEKGKEYGYGFWYLEKTTDEQAYRWTKAESGVYIALDKKGESKPFKLLCGAPLDKLENKKQVVKVFWKGDLYEKVVFKENKEHLFKIKGKPLSRGFLELRISPVFNMKKLKLSPESRDLGVQFYTLF